jgi:Ser-tRNA(Ala) deacylase AlaX
MNTFDLDTARNLPKGTITRESDGEREYLRIGAKRVPLVITPRQIRLALHRLYSIPPAGVEAVLATLPEPARTEAQIEWEYATKVERTHPMIDTLAAVLSQAYGVQVDADEVFAVGGAIGGDGL